MSEKPFQNAYQLAARIALIALGLAVIVAALLIYDYSRRLVKDPLDSVAYNALRTAVNEQPANEKLKEQFREMDLQLRQEYFRQKVFAWTGAVLLLIFTAVFLAAAKMAATLHRPMPSPEMLPAPRDFEAAWTTVARWTVGAAGLLIVAVVIGLSFMGRQSWLQDDN